MLLNRWLFVSGCVILGEAVLIRDSHLVHGHVSMHRPPRQMDTDGEMYDQPLAFLQLVSTGNKN